MSCWTYCNEFPTRVSRRDGRNVENVFGAHRLEFAPFFGQYVKPAPYVVRMPQVICDWVTSGGALGCRIFQMQRFYHHPGTEMIGNGVSDQPPRPYIPCLEKNARALFKTSRSSFACSSSRRRRRSSSSCGFSRPSPGKVSDCSRTSSRF